MFHFEPFECMSEMLNIDEPTPTARKKPQVEGSEVSFLPFKIFQNANLVVFLPIVSFR